MNVIVDARVKCLNTRHSTPRAHRVLAINTPLVSNSSNLSEDEEKGRFARRFLRFPRVARDLLLFVVERLVERWWLNVFLNTCEL